MMVRIGQECTLQLDTVTAQQRVIVTVGPMYARGVCEEAVIQPLTPAHRFEGPLPSVERGVRVTLRADASREYLLSLLGLPAADGGSFQAARNRHR